MKNAGEACYQCTDRHIGCHSNCERYLKCAEEYREEKRQWNEQKKKETEIDDFLKRSAGKARKRKKR